MIRWLLWLLAGALLGGIVHLVAVLILPRTATQDAYSRLSPIAPVNAVAALPQPTAQSEVMPFMPTARESRGRRNTVRSTKPNRINGKRPTERPLNPSSSTRAVAARTERLTLFS